MVDVEKGFQDIKKKSMFSKPLLRGSISILQSGCQLIKVRGLLFLRIISLINFIRIGDVPLRCVSSLETKRNEMETELSISVLLRKF